MSVHNYVKKVIRAELRRSTIMSIIVSVCTIIQLLAMSVALIYQLLFFMNCSTDFHYLHCLPSKEISHGAKSIPQSRYTIEHR